MLGKTLNACVCWEKPFIPNPHPPSVPIRSIHGRFDCPSRPCGCDFWNYLQMQSEPLNPLGLEVDL